MATGCIGLALDDFERCTPSEFRAIAEAWDGMRQRSERSEWERARMQCLCMLQPHSRQQLKTTDVMRFTWDDEKEDDVDRAEPQTAAEIMKRFEKVKKEIGC